MKLEEFKTVIKTQTVTAMKAKDSVRLLTLRSISNAIVLQEKDNTTKEINYIDILSSMAKSRKQSIDAYTKAGNSLLADAETTELNIIEEFLPKMLTDDEIKQFISNIISNLDYTPTIKDMGKILNTFKSEYPGQDMAKVSSIIKEKI